MNFTGYVSLVSPEGVLPDGVNFMLGGQDNQTPFPPLNSASNFTRFLPPYATDTLEDLFEPRLSKASIPATRFIRQSNPSEFLIYTDGTCSENGDKDARGGCAFVFRPETSPSMIPSKTASGHSTRSMNLHKLGAAKFRLESRGPTGEAVPQTSNLAELRAVIAALRFRLWNNEGCQRLVIATDSSYVVDGSTEWIKKWMADINTQTGEEPGPLERAHQKTREMEWKGGSSTVLACSKKAKHGSRSIGEGSYRSCGRKEVDRNQGYIVLIRYGG